MAAPRSVIRTNEDLKERLQNLIDNLLLRFKNIIELASLPVRNVTKEQGASQAYQINVETSALVRSVEDLLKLTREMKEMWLFGKLHESGNLEVHLERATNTDVHKVVMLIQNVLQQFPDTAA